MGTVEETAETEAAGDYPPWQPALGLPIPIPTEVREAQAAEAEAERQKELLAKKARRKLSLPKFFTGSEKANQKALFQAKKEAKQVAV